jgi:VanZ family protein
MKCTSNGQYPRFDERGAVAAAQPGGRRLAGRLSTFVALGLLMVLLAIHQLVSFGSDSAVGGSLRNALHIPLFAVLTLLLARILDSPRWWVLLLAALVLGVGTEAVQLLTARDASVRDIGINLIGIVPVVAGIEATRHLRRRRARPTLITALWLGLAALLLLATLAGPVRLLLVQA